MRKFPIFLIVIAPLFVCILTESGCRPSCDAIPSQSLANIRIVNAISNSTLLLVYIDGNLFDSCWYDIATKYNNRTHIFGYRNKSLASGFQLTSGQHHIAAMDATSRDTVATWNGNLRDFRQSLIFVGKINGSVAQEPRAIYLNDNTRHTQSTTYVRFVDAVPDINGAQAGGLDVYFSDSIPRSNGRPLPPNLRIHFGHISDQSGGDRDTIGLSDTDYIPFPPNVAGLLILPINDTNTSDAILFLPSTYSLPTSFFLATVLVRGETQPLDEEPIASTLVLEDDPADPGTVAFDIPTFFIRMVNATRQQILSLLIKGPADAGPRAGIPQGGGKAVLDLGSDSVGGYIPLNPNFDGVSRYWFSKSDSPSDTIFTFVDTEVENERTTIIAIDTIAHNTGNVGIDSMRLTDTLSNPKDYDPTDTIHGAVRFVNTTADYTANFTFAGQAFSMKQRDVRILNTPVGTYSIPITDGITSGTINFTVTDVRPTTIFFMPSTPGSPITYRISTE